MVENKGVIARVTISGRQKIDERKLLKELGLLGKDVGDNKDLTEDQNIDNYRAKEVLEYTKTLDNIQGTASSIAIDTGIIALDKIENTSQKLESLIDNMEIYTAGRPNTEKVQVSVLQMQRFINEIKDIKNHLN